MKYLSRDDINQELRNLGENNLDDFVKKYFINEEKKYGEKILVLFKVKPQQCCFCLNNNSKQKGHYEERYNNYSVIFYHNVFPL